MFLPEMAPAESAAAKMIATNRKKSIPTKSVPLSTPLR